MGLAAGGGCFLFLEVTAVRSIVDPGVSSSSLVLVCDVWGGSRPLGGAINLSSSVRALFMNSFMLFPGLLFKCLWAISNALFFSVELRVLKVVISGLGYTIINMFENAVSYAIDCVLHNGFQMVCCIWVGAGGDEFPNPHVFQSFADGSRSVFPVVPMVYKLRSLKEAPPKAPEVRVDGLGIGCLPGCRLGRGSGLNV